MNPIKEHFFAPLARRAGTAVSAWLAGVGATSHQIETIELAVIVGLGLVWDLGTSYAWRRNDKFQAIASVFRSIRGSK